jgi:UDP-GlcNAc:undecaprenyl-phosphate/decaprenyl-phosphate GlcNAc-1-phosphate transferase
MKFVNRWQEFLARYYKTIMIWLNPDILIILSSILSIVIVFSTVPFMVSVAHLKQIYDASPDRKDQNIPNLGGIALFLSLMVSAGLFINIYESKELAVIPVAIIILLFTGLKKDIRFSAKTIYGQILAAIIVVVLADLRLTSLQGFLGIYEIDYIPSILFTVLVTVTLINGFTIIDGINGLASGVGFFAALTLGVWFYLAGHYNYAILSAVICGSLITLFCFNVFSTKNKIVLGNNGLLVLGLIICVLTIKFIEFNKIYNGPFTVSSSPGVSFGILIIPFFDSIRIIIIGIIKKQLPFQTDDNYLYKRVMQLGYSQISATLGFLIVNILFIFLMFSCQTAGTTILMILNLSLATFFIIMLEILIQRSSYGK